MAMSASTSSGRGAGIGRGRGGASAASVSSSKMSSGRITATGPGVPDSARWKARAIASEACSGSFTSITSLEMSESRRE